MENKIKSFNEIEQEDYFQWAKETGRCKYQLTDVMVNRNGEFKLEKVMCWVLHTSPDDYKEFCKETGREFEETKVLAYNNKFNITG